MGDNILAMVLHPPKEGGASQEKRSSMINVEPGMTRQRWAASFWNGADC